MFKIKRNKRKPDLEIDMMYFVISFCFCSHNANIFTGWQWYRLLESQALRKELLKELDLANKSKVTISPTEINLCVANHSIPGGLRCLFECECCIDYTLEPKVRFKKGFLLCWQKRNISKQ